MTMYSAIDHAINMLRQREHPPYFSDIAHNVAVSTGYPLHVFRFRQIWNIVPNKFFVRWKNGALQVSLYAFGTSIGKIKPEEMKKRIDHFETMLKLTSSKNFKSTTDGFKGILPDLNLAMHELPERPAAPKRAADFKQTEFETLLDQTERKPIISNYHLTKAVETADVELRIPSAVGKFARAVVLGRMHARKHHFVPDWHWIWMDKYLEKSDFIAQQVYDIENA